MPTVSCPCGFTGYFSALTTRCPECGRAVLPPPGRTTLHGATGEPATLPDASERRLVARHLVLAGAAVVVVTFGLLAGCLGVTWWWRGGTSSSAIRKGAEPVLPEEKLALEEIKKHFDHVSVIEWGPHDLTNRLATKRAKRIKEGWKDFETRITRFAVPGTKFVRVYFRYIPDRPAVGSLLLAVRDGRLVTLDRFHNLSYVKPTDRGAMELDEDRLWLDKQLATMDEPSH